MLNEASEVGEFVASICFHQIVNYITEEEE